MLTINLSHTVSFIILIFVCLQCSEIRKPTPPIGLPPALKFNDKKNTAPKAHKFINHGIKIKAKKIKIIQGVSLDPLDLTELSRAEIRNLRYTLYDISGYPELLAQWNNDFYSTRNRYKFSRKPQIYLSNIDKVNENILIEREKKAKKINLTHNVRHYTWLMHSLRKRQKRNTLCIYQNVIDDDPVTISNVRFAHGIRLPRFEKELPWDQWHESLTSQYVFSQLYDFSSNQHIYAARFTKSCGDSPLKYIITIPIRQFIPDTKNPIMFHFYDKTGNLTKISTKDGGDTHRETIYNYKKGNKISHIINITSRNAILQNIETFIIDNKTSHRKEK